MTVKDAETSWKPQFTFFQRGVGFFNIFFNEFCGVARKPILATAHAGKTQVSLSFEQVVQALENNREQSLATQLYRR